jgi:Transglutaminase-like superfamily
MTRGSPEAAGVAQGAAFAPGRRGWLERIVLVAEIATAYARTRRSLGRVPIAVLVARLRACGTGGAPPERTARASRGEDSLAQARGLGRAVVRTLALLPGDARCLARSLVLTRLLARRGISARLVIGTSTGPDFIAHAWVEHDGEPVLWPGDGSFGRLVEL